MPSSLIERTGDPFEKSSHLAFIEKRLFEFFVGNRDLVREIDVFHVVENLDIGNFSVKRLFPLGVEGCRLRDLDEHIFDHGAEGEFLATKEGERVLRDHRVDVGSPDLIDKIRAELVSKDRVVEKAVCDFDEVLLRHAVKTGLKLVGAICESLQDLECVGHVFLPHFLVFFEIISSTIENAVGVFSSSSLFFFFEGSGSGAELTRRLKYS